MPDRKKANRENELKRAPEAGQAVEPEEALSIEFMDALLDRCCPEEE
ncbi:MAG: hypothetical protein PWR22_930 [Moorella sp. (in: firmicutes)]|jgi:hypothetical protein|nr:MULTISPECIES: hypothetical protein [unclassified Moorella (in: firmicutes)]MDK2816301.1 hypothetical protein [Moorella sp. (in: firmicutes)]GEA14126.1 hypothetical protein E308F_03670 [Moorella sp. E308F]GEA18488.1 hypothetical protein E306M_16250 [Moorella sp. E306M]